MHLLTVPVLAAACLLWLAGGLKLSRPAGTAQALRTQGLPSGAGVVRDLGAAEVAVASAALLQLPLSRLLLALAYLGFTLFVVVAMVRRRPLSSCGCFADPDLPPTWAHVVVTAGLALAAAVAVSGAPAGVPAVLAQPSWTALGTAAATALVAWLAYLVLAVLPEVSTAARPTDEPHDAHGRKSFALVPVRSTAP